MAARLQHLERPRDALAVAGSEPGRGLRVALREAAVHLLGSRGVELRLEPRADLGHPRRRSRESGGEGLEVEPRASDQDRQVAARRDGATRLGGGARVPAGARPLVEPQRVEQVVRHGCALARRGLAGADLELAVHLARVGAYHLGIESVGQPLAELGLAGGGGPQDGDHARERVQQAG